MLILLFFNYVFLTELFKHNHWMSIEYMKDYYYTIVVQSSYF